MLLHRLDLSDQTGFSFSPMDHPNYNGKAPDHALDGMAQAYCDNDILSKVTKFVENRWGYGNRYTEVVVMGRKDTIAKIGDTLRIRVTQEPFLITAGTPAWLKVSAIRATYEPVLQEPLFLVRTDVKNLPQRIDKFFQKAFARVQTKV